MIIYTCGNARYTMKGVGRMFDKNKLKAKFVENGLTMEQVAQLLGINPVTLYRKMSGDSEFTRNEIAMLKNALNISLEEISNIFFA